MSIESSAVISLTQYCTGFTAPVDIRNCGDSRLFVVEQPGRIRIIDSTGTLLATSFLDISSSVLYSGERGLLGLAFAPDYASTGYFYVNYTARPSGHTRISRFRVNATNPNLANASSEEILMTIYQPYSNHNGGCLAFSPVNGYLYIGMGDGGSANDPGNRAQNPDTLLGKMLRLQVTSGVPGYAIPPGNPFYQQPSQGRQEIWSIGMRNPWRFSFDPLNGDLWIGDVGQNLYEEIDYEPGTVTAGRNYGWRCYEGMHTFNTTGCAAASAFTPPVWEYQHSSGNCSVTGGYIYRGAKYADMYGKYFFTDYCVNQMRTLQKSGNSFSHVNLGTLASGSYVAFGVDSWGELYAADAVGGRIMRFSSTVCNPVAAINGGAIDTVFSCDGSPLLLSTPRGKDFQYAWSVNGTLLSHNYDTLSAAFDSDIVLTVTDTSGCQASDTVYLRTAPAVPVSFSGLDSVYCTYNSPVILTPNPLGGQFSGPGMSGVSFDPAAADTGLNVIRYTYSDTYGCSRIAEDSVTVDLCLGLASPSASVPLELFPTASDGHIRIRTALYAPLAVTLTVYDLSGKLVYREPVVPGSRLLDHPLDLSQLEKGGYILGLSDGQSADRYARFLISR
ncbi:MAG: hypothetical protein RL021_1056 [Bacteroidota bacterium]